jgi:hypothetical protein
VVSIVGATLELSGFSPDVSQKELRELEGRFEKLKLHGSDKIGNGSNKPSC